MKKILSVILAVIMIASLAICFSSCGEETTATAADKATEAPATTTAAPETTTAEVTTAEVTITEVTTVTPTTEEQTTTAPEVTTAPETTTAAEVTTAAAEAAVLTRHLAGAIINFYIDGKNIIMEVDSASNEGIMFKYSLSERLYTLSPGESAVLNKKYLVINLFTPSGGYTHIKINDIG